MTRTALGKQPVSGPREVSTFGLEGDCRVEERKFGDAEQALSVYPYEHYARWGPAPDGRALGPGDFGENLTVLGLDERRARIGDVLQCGDCTVQVSHPRIPCAKLDLRMGPGFSGRFLRSGRVGYYLRVLRPGRVRAGDELVSLRPAAGSPTVDEFLRISQIDYWDAQGLEHLLRAHDLNGQWRGILEDKLQRARLAAGWFGTRGLIVSGRRPEGEDAFSVELRCPTGRPLAPFRGGQVLTLSHRSAEASRALRRVFPISGPRADGDGHYRITVPRPARGGAASDELLHSLDRDLQVGATVRATAPRGNITLDPVGPFESIALFGDSLGFARVMGLLHEWSTRPDQGRADVFHSDGGSPSRAFEDELETLGRTHPLLAIYRGNTKALVEHASRRQPCFAYVIGSTDFGRRLLPALSRLGFDARLVGPTTQ